MKKLKPRITYRQALRKGYLKADDLGYSDYARCYMCGADGSQLTLEDAYLEDIGGFNQVVEGTVRCKKCGEIQGHWAYGSVDPVYVSEKEPTSKWEDLL